MEACGERVEQFTVLTIPLARNKVRRNLFPPKGLLLASFSVQKCPALLLKDCLMSDGAEQRANFIIPIVGPAGGHISDH